MSQKNRFFYLVSLAACLAFTTTQAFDVTGCISGNCVNGYGTYIDENSVQYKGEFKDGKPHGLGNFDWPNGVEYFGDVANGQMHGKGKMYWPSGRKNIRLAYQFHHRPNPANLRCHRKELPRCFAVTGR